MTVDTEHKQFNTSIVWEQNPAQKLQVVVMKQINLIFKPQINVGSFHFLYFKFMDRYLAIYLSKVGWGGVVPQCVYGGQRETFLIGCFLLPCGLRWTSSGQQVWGQVPLSSSSGRASYYFLLLLLGLFPHKPFILTLNNRSYLLWFTDGK